MKPRIFVASSSQHLDLAYAVQEGLERDAEVTVWTQDVFEVSRTTMASLMDVLDESDFGLFILAPSDVTKIRGDDRATVRDNVIFELGLFIGRLGSNRCFMIVPRDADDLHLPTDLLGLTPATYEPDRQDGNLVAALGPACNRIRKAIGKLGRNNAIPTSPTDAPQEISEEPLTSDENDCISLIQSWLGSRSAGENRMVIRYDEVDENLKLVPGSARQYIERAAARWLDVERKGKDTILFTPKPRPFYA